MREIKFRAWDTVNRRWTEIESIAIARNDTPAYIVAADGKTYQIERNGAGQIALMQFTGLKDKNGVEIYEGDIIRSKWQDRAELIWISDEACFAPRTIDDVVKDEIMYGFKEAEMEVIGNIYQNPDLLV